MKIIATVATKNEERNIAQFINSYSWADEILIADGNSDDSTVAIVTQMQLLLPNVYLKIFDERVPGQTEEAYSHHRSKQVNFLLDWAIERSADWVIYDDCDCRPNYLLKQDGRTLLENASGPMVGIVRLYVWKDTGKYFPWLSKPEIRHKEWGYGIWAWRPESGIRADEEHGRYDPHFGLSESDMDKITPPYCILHHPWPDEETIQKKKDFYESVFWNDGEPRVYNHPLKSNSTGPLEDLPEWARE